MIKGNGVIILNLKKLKEKKGNSILTSIVIAPFLTMFMTYFVFSFTFNRANNYFYNVTNSTFDRVLIEGQLTNELKDDMYRQLEKMKFDRSDIEIKTTDPSIDDGNDLTYVTRGSEVKIQILHKKPHEFYHINNIMTLGSVSETSFYVGSVFTGMSEKY